MRRDRPRADRSDPVGRTGPRFGPSPGGRRRAGDRGVVRLHRATGAPAAVRAAALGIRVAHAIYAAMSGPAYETPTEVGMLRRLGATVVGMSMVPEALPALALGMRVLGICSLTNAFGEHVTHEEVVRVSNETALAVGRLLVDLLPRLPGSKAGT